jgi:hypothetical protein
VGYGAGNKWSITRPPTTSCDGSGLRKARDQRKGALSAIKGTATTAVYRQGAARGWAPIRLFPYFRRWPRHIWKDRTSRVVRDSRGRRMGKESRIGLLSFNQLRWTWDRRPKYMAWGRDKRRVKRTSLSVRSRFSPFTSEFPSPCLRAVVWHGE